MKNIIKTDMSHIKDFEGWKSMNEAIENDPKIYTAVVDILADVKDGKLVSNLDETEPNFIEELVKDIDYTILREEGPAGGWPEVEFKGTKKQLLPILQAVAADGPDDVEAKLDKWDGSQNGLLDIIG